MHDYDPAAYGDSWAAVYDDLFHDLPDEDQCVERLAAVVGNGQALELGLGTGRIALPLALRGTHVEGIEKSAKMVSRLREKPGGSEIVVHVGDFANVDVSDSYDLIYVVFNTFFYLTTQEEQIRCFINVAAHLNSEGSFIIEALTPDPCYPSQVLPYEVTADRATLYIANRDAATQRADIQFLIVGDGRISHFHESKRYAPPAELDLMARLAGLRLKDRWGGWLGEPFTSSSTKHVSVYGHDLS